MSHNTSDTNADAKNDNGEETDCSALQRGHTLSRNHNQTVSKYTSSNQELTPAVSKLANKLLQNLNREHIIVDGKNRIISCTNMKSKCKTTYALPPETKEPTTNPLQDSNYVTLANKLLTLTHANYIIIDRKTSKVECKGELLNRKEVYTLRSECDKSNLMNVEPQESPTKLVLPKQRASGKDEVPMQQTKTTMQQSNHEDINIYESISKAVLYSSPDEERFVENPQNYRQKTKETTKGFQTETAPSTSTITSTSDLIYKILSDQARSRGQTMQSYTKPKRGFQTHLETAPTSAMQWQNLGDYRPTTSTSASQNTVNSNQYYPETTKASDTLAPIHSYNSARFRALLPPYSSKIIFKNSKSTSVAAVNNNPVTMTECQSKVLQNTATSTNNTAFSPYAKKEETHTQAHSHETTSVVSSRTEIAQQIEAPSSLDSLPNTPRSTSSQRPC